MTLRSRITVLLTVMITSLQVQGQAVIRLGPVLGYRQFSATVSASPEPDVITTQGASGLMPTASLSVGTMLPVGSDLAVRADVEAQWSWATLSRPYATVFSIGGEAQNGTIRRDVQVSSSSLGLSAGLAWFPSADVSLSAGLGAMFPPTLQIAVRDEIESPTGVTFVSTGTPERDLGSGWLAGGPAQTYGFAQIAASKMYRIGPQWQVAPQARARVALTSALANEAWFPWEIGIGLDVGFAFASAAAVPSAPDVGMAAQYYRSVRDTVTLVDAFQIGRTDTLWVLDTTDYTETVRGPDVDTLILTQHIRVERHLPGPPPFLSTMLDVIADDQAADSVAAVWISVECVSDTTATTTVTMSADQQPVWTEVVRGPHAEWTVLLRDVLPDISTRQVIVLEVSAVTTDAVGQSLSAVPRVVTLRRTPQNSNLQRSR